ncbi:GNAT family N-acetyltransferase [Micrococcus endophyticus]|uniref:Putative N-acetyltransferase YhbS n=1 Tax=Micrococcus endophyticus TaxID=455343 RepID=A0A7W9MZZ4_9MICC|nr:putative N-acetyltransferase YhbS [Micrococcus endophyticus]
MLDERGPRVDQALEARHPAEPHWYLGLLTVAPDAQVGGVGSALVRAGLARADADGLPAYLECERHREAYYARFGVARTPTVEIDDGAPAHLGMWRPAGG